MTKRGGGSAGLFSKIASWFRTSKKLDKGKKPEQVTPSPKVDSNPVPPKNQPSAAPKAKYSELQPMRDLFKNETDPVNGPFKGQSVKRLTPEEREKYRVSFDNDGLLRTHDNELFDSTNATGPWGPRGEAIFIMDKNGEKYTSNYQASGEFHHSTLSNGEDVAASGGWKVTNGKVEYATAESGHYLPEKKHMANLNQEFKDNNVQAPIYNHHGPMYGMARPWFQ